MWIKSQTRVMQYRYSEIKEGGYLTAHVQLPLIVDYPDEFLDEITWQELMNNWANQGLGQFLADDKTVLVAHINRAVTYDGVLTKRKRALNPHGAFTVPRSLDGFSRASSEYMPIAYICHRGPTHESGHYFAILVYRDSMWIADDGGRPTVLPFWHHNLLDKSRRSGLSRQQPLSHQDKSSGRYRLQRPQITIHSSMAHLPRKPDTPMTP